MIHFFEAVGGIFDWRHLFLVVVVILICFFLIALTSRFPRLAGSNGILRAKQAFHHRPTPRVGGIAIFVALLIVIQFTPEDIISFYTKVLVATSLLFTAGLLEDLGFDISPKKRLCAGLFASVLLILLLGEWMPRLGIARFDWLTEFSAIGIPLTLLLTVGMANAFNLIDGANGLASLVAMASTSALAVISYLVGYQSMVVLMLLLLACIFGFFLVNFPLGKIFLGDSGAYSLGFILSWFAIELMLYSTEVTPWALLLVAFWPVADTVLAIYRRGRKKTDKMSPDRLHFHQLVMRGLEIYVLGRGKRHFANPLSTVIIAPFIIVPVMAGIYLWDKPLQAFIALVFFSAVFFGTYALSFPLLRFSKRKRYLRNV